MNHKTQWDDLVWHMTQIEHPINYLIAATPSGDVRNLITEANIHFKEAEEKLMKAVEVAKRQLA